MERKQSQDRAPCIILYYYYLVLMLISNWEWNWSIVYICQSSESLGKLEQIARSRLYPKKKKKIESKQCEDELELIISFDLIFIAAGLGWCCYLWRWKAEEKMRWAIAGRLSLSHFATDGQVLSATREIRLLQANTWTKFWILAIFECANPKVSSQVLSKLPWRRKVCLSYASLDRRKVCLSYAGSSQFPQWQIFLRAHAP